MIGTDPVRAEALSLLALVRSGREGDEGEALRQARLPADEGGRRAAADACDGIGTEAFNDGDASAARDAFWPLVLWGLAIVERHPGGRDDFSQPPGR